MNRPIELDPRPPSMIFALVNPPKLIGRIKGAPDIPLCGVPPTRLSGPCKAAIKEIADKLQARQKTKHP